MRRRLHGETVTITARLSGEIAHAFEAMRDRQWGRPRLKLTYSSRVVEGEVGSIRRTVRAGGSDEVEIELVRVQPPQVDVMRAGTGGLSADDLVEAGMRALFLGEPLPASVGMLDFMTSPCKWLFRVSGLQTAVTRGQSRGLCDVRTWFARQPRKGLDQAVPNGL